MIHRVASNSITEVLAAYPILAVTGPRQSGKTTLCRMLFPDKPYVSFEDPDVRARFESDPRNFLAAYSDGAVFDEAQKCPELFSYLQGIVDGDSRMGRFVLTGSSQFQLFAGITQSLAGRVVTLQLLPFSFEELADDGTYITRESGNLDELLFNGLYPPIYDRKAAPALWYANYVQNYIERDVRELLNVKNLSTFHRFLKLCAARTGSLLNLSEISNETGVSYNTIKSWISVLEASYIVYLLQPFHSNYSKRLVKTPKIYFYDTGLLCWLLSIKNIDQLKFHPMRGHIFESLVISEMHKKSYNRFEQSPLYFWRDRSGNEIDILIDHGLSSTPVEIKSGATFQKKYCHQIKKWQQISGSKEAPVLIYGGNEDFNFSGCHVRTWRTIHASITPCRPDRFPVSK